MFWNVALCGTIFFFHTTPLIFARNSKKKKNTKKLFGKAFIFYEQNFFVRSLNVHIAGEMFDTLYDNYRFVV